MNTRRPSILAVAILLSALLIGGTGGAIAAGQIGTGQIENGAVTTPKLAKNAVTSKKVKNGALTTLDLAPSARGAKVIRYPVEGSHDFDADSLVCADLPGLTADAVRSSQWSAGMESGGIFFMIGTWGLGPSSEYRMSVSTDDPGRACLILVSGTGETYDNIAFFRTVPTKVLASTIQSKQASARLSTTQGETPASGRGLVVFGLLDRCRGTWT